MTTRVEASIGEQVAERAKRLAPARLKEEAAASVEERKVKRRVRKERRKTETWPMARLRRHAGYI